MEFKFLQHNKNLRPRVREPEQKKRISMDSTIYHMQDPQRARIKRTLDRMTEHDGNIKYDRYFTHNNTHIYIDVLQELASGYNAFPHKGVRMAPIEVSDSNQLKFGIRIIVNE